MTRTPMKCSDRTVRRAIVWNKPPCERTLTEVTISVTFGPPIKIRPPFLSGARHDGTRTAGCAQPESADRRSRRREVSRRNVPRAPSFRSVSEIALRPIDSLAADHDLTIVVPAFNEEMRLPATLDGLAAYLDPWGIDYRVLVVDDGSRDGTARLTQRCGPKFSTISQVNRGKGAAVRKGVLHATGRVVAFTDADLPYDLDGLRVAYDFDQLAKQCEVVFGARGHLKESTVLSAAKISSRTLAHWVFSQIMRLLISREVTDTQCGLKIFSRRAAVEIFSRTTIDGFAFDAEVVFLATRLSLPFRRIPVTLINEYASTISLTRHAIPMVMDVIQLRRRARRGDYGLDQLPSAVATAKAKHEQQGTAA